MTESATHSPTPWKVEADTRIETAYGSRLEYEVLAGWNVHDADGTEIIGCEGILGDREHVARRLVDAVNLHDEMVEALKACRDELASIHGLYGDHENAREHSAALRLACSALSKSTPAQEGE